VAAHIVLDGLKHASPTKAIEHFCRIVAITVLGEIQGVAEEVF
jgi:hypothetical protein